MEILVFVSIRLPALTMLQNERVFERFSLILLW